MKKIVLLLCIVMLMGCSSNNFDVISESKLTNSNVTIKVLKYDSKKWHDFFPSIEEASLKHGVYLVNHYEKGQFMLFRSEGYTCSKVTMEVNNKVLEFNCVEEKVAGVNSNHFFLIEGKEEDFDTIKVNKNGQPADNFQVIGISDKPL